MDEQAGKYEKFDMQIWKTIGARFNAYRRLGQKQSMSVFTISILSVYILALSLLPLNKLYPALVDYVASLSALSSIFVLILSLLESSKNYELRADRLHNNAKQLNELYSRFISVRGNKAPIDDIVAEYHKLIKECPENHMPYDLELFTTGHQAVFKLSKWEVCRIRTIYVIRTNFFYVLLLAIPVLIVFAQALFNGTKS